MNCNDCDWVLNHRFCDTNRCPLVVKRITNDPEPQADDVETIRMYIDKWKRKSLTHKQAREEALAALSRLSAPIDVQAKADAVVDLFADSYAPLNAIQKQELSRIIVEQFLRKG
jgi:hypothetical protein